MRLLLTALACLVSVSMVGQTNTSEIQHCIAENQMSLDKINPNNRYKAEDSKKTLFSPVTTIKFISNVVDK